MDKQLRFALDELLAAAEEVESYVLEEYGTRLTEAVENVHRELRRVDFAELIAAKNLPSAADLDRVADEQAIAEATVHEDLSEAAHGN